MKSSCVFVFLLLGHFSHETLPCPALCKCFPSRAEVVCNEVPLAEFPSEGLPDKTTMLTIQFTNITSLSEHQLNATPLLQELHLFRNQLQNLSSHLLRGVPHLHTLDLTGNQLSDIPADIFSHASLRNLVLKNNLIKEADAEWLPANSSLIWLDLSENLLRQTPTLLLQRLPHLENLDLSSNHLEKIPSHSLDLLMELKQLNLQNNKLHTLDASAFLSLNNLTSLFLAHNHLKNLPQTLFQGLRRVRHLSLDNNQLSHIPAGLLDQLDSLEDQGLDMSGNPLLCDGKVEYLWRWLQKNKKKVFEAESITCAFPQPLMGRSVSSLTENQLNL
nr:leucine-rich alpha-2-glycoprotein isoform X2 [Nothobranchius furzeri]